MKLRSIVSAASATVLAVSLSLVSAAPARAEMAGAAPAPQTTAPGSYNPVSPVRILDTRSGIGAPKVTVGPLATITFTVPPTTSGPVGSVLLEVTVVNPTAAGYATVFPAGTARPIVSNINFQAGENVPNMVVTAVGTGSKVSIFNGSKGTVDLLADVNGYFLAGTNAGDPGTLVPMTPVRFLDTRSGQGAAKAQVKPMSVTKVQIAGRGGVPATATAVAVNVTAVHAGGKGFLAVYPGDPIPDASSLNFEAKQDRANLALVELGADGTISIYDGSPSSVDLLADVSGYFVGGGTASADGSFTPSSTFRVFDSRMGGSELIPALSTVKVPIFEPNDPFASFVKAVALNITVANPLAAGFLTTWDGAGTITPAVSNSNFQRKQDVAGSIVVPVNDDGTISIYNGSLSNIDLIVDFNGLFYQDSTQVPNRTSPDARPAAPTAAQVIAAAKKFSATWHRPSITSKR